MDGSINSTESHLNDTVSHLNVSNNATAGPLAGGASIRVITGFIFGVLGLATNGSLLAIFTYDRRTRKHLSFAMLCNFVNIMLFVITDMAFRLPITIIGEQQVVDISSHLCLTFFTCADFFSMSALLLLPLFSVEKLIKVLHPDIPDRKSRCLLVMFAAIASAVAFLYVMLPVLKTYEKDTYGFSLRCNAKFGVSYLYLYIALAGCTTVLTAVLLFLTVKFVLKALHNKTITQRRKGLLRRGMITTITITVILFFATVPFGVLLQIQFGACTGHIIMSDYICNKLIPPMFRITALFQELIFTVIPFIFVSFNPVLRRKLLLHCKACWKKSIPVQSLSSNSSSQSQSYTNHAADETSAVNRSLKTTIMATANLLKRNNFHDKLIYSVEKLPTIMECPEDASVSGSLSRSSMNKKSRSREQSMKSGEDTDLRHA